MVRQRTGPNGTIKGYGREPVPKVTKKVPQRTGPNGTIKGYGREPVPKVPKVPKGGRI